MLFRLLTSPARGLGFIFRSIHEASLAEADDEREFIRHRLHEIYAQVESGELDEESFEALEDELLNRLDALDAMEDTPVAHEDSP
jgi:hypothetical protein